MAIVEIARSLLPEKMSLDLNFPVTSLLGLSHDEAVSLLRNYYESQGISKIPQFFKKRDTTFYLNEIFGILDFFHSQHAKTLSLLINQPDSEPTPDHNGDAISDSDPTGDLKLITQPTSDTDNENKLSIVTPNPPSPSKKRKTGLDDIANDCLQEHLDLESNQDVFVAMNELTWDEIYNMPKYQMSVYIKAYTEKKNIPLSPTYFDDTLIDDMRETLAIHAIELHTETSFSVFNATTSDSFIEKMDPIWV